VDERRSKIGKNEALFRRVNEEVRAVVGEQVEQPSEMRMLCECGDSECVTELRIRPLDYEALRADPLLFAVASGHTEGEVERVIEHRDGYDVVRKDSGPAAKLAQVTDPRGS